MTLPPAEQPQKVIPVSETGNGHKIRPDSQTKRVLGAGFLAAMGVMGFLALQVWNLNGSMKAMEANDRIREDQLKELKLELREMRTEFRQAIESLRQELKGK